MKRNKLMIFLAPVVVMLVTLACGFSASTASIKDAVMAKDSESAQATVNFAPTDTFYCNVSLANAPDDTKVRAEWTAVSVEGADANTPLDKTEMTTGSGTVNFKLTNSSPWPAGQYKVDLFLNDKLTKTVEFNVQ